MENRQMHAVTDYGAVGDGKTLNTAYIQAAIDACAAHGGGTVVFPKGVYRSGTVRLRGGITYWFERGSVLRGSGDMADYTHNGFYHPELVQTISLLWAIGEEGIRLTGEGKIDFSAREFFAGAEMATIEGIDCQQLTPEQCAEAVVEIRPRPTQPVFFDSCRDVELDSITLLDSPCWTVSFSRCERVRVHHITVQNSLVIPNCDGVHFSCCRDVLVSDSSFSCGDDCVAVTGITAQNESDCSERIIISRCHMRSRSAAVRLGHLDSKIRDVIVSDLVITDSNRGFAIFSGDNGCVEDVLISRVIMQTRIVAGAWWGKGEAAVICAEGGNGCIRRVTLSQIRAQCEGGILLASTDTNVRDILLQDIELRIRAGRNYPLFGGDLDFRPNGYIPGAADLQQGIFVHGEAGVTSEKVRDI